MGCLCGASGCDGRKKKKIPIGLETTYIVDVEPVTVTKLIAMV